MAIDAINPYGMSNSGLTGAGAGKSLDMEDYFRLLVAQLSNQDMFNTVDDTQFISQMAQFSMVQALNELSRASATAYGVSLIGKEVSILRPGSDGNVYRITGLVDSVIMQGGSTRVAVGDELYDLSEVIQVKEANIILPRGDLSAPGNPPGGESDD